MGVGGFWGTQRKAKLAQFIAPFGIAVYSQRLGQRWAEATFSADFRSIN
jgi:hypothetical protein